MDGLVEYESSGPVINSENFIQYLKGLRFTESGSYMGGRRENFAKAIDVGDVISDAISQMYTTPKFDQETGEMLEQGRLVYVDIETGEIKTTSPTYGSPSEVDLRKMKQEVLNMGGSSILEMHDHPGYGGLFTPPDYFSIIFGNSKRMIRGINGIVILCPGMQIMALATDETPIIDDPYKVNEYITSKMANILEQEEQAVNEGLADLQTEVNIRGQVQLLGQVLSQAGHGDTADKALQVANARVDAATKEAYDKHYRVDNTLLVNLANELRVKLYFSTDTRNFKEFSA